jgi:hypothetical protein
MAAAHDNEQIQEQFIGETWKIIKIGEIEYNYEVSSFGNIKNKTTQQILKPSNDAEYYRIKLGHPTSPIKLRINQLVATMFIPNPNNYPLVNHIDYNTLNNKIENLEWITHSGNNQHAADYGLTVKKRVTQYSLNEDEELVEIATFESCKAAGIATGTDRTSITKVCKGRQETANSFYWKYTDEQPQHAQEIDLTTFKQVRDFPQYYVNSQGTVYSSKNPPSIMNPKARNGNKEVSFTRSDETVNDNGEIKITIVRKSYMLHNLVAKYFVPNDDPINKKLVSHIDGNKLNNIATNLYWTTQRHLNRIGRRHNIIIESVNDDNN